MKQLLLACLPSYVQKAKFEQVWAACLDEMLLLYYPPFRAKSEDELQKQCVIALRAYVLDLAGYGRETIAEAWQQVRRQHKVTRWPAIADILEACGYKQRVVEAKEYGGVPHYLWQGKTWLRDVMAGHTEKYPGQDRVTIASWLRGCELEGQTLYCRSQLTLDWINNNFRNQLEDCLGFMPSLVVDFIKADPILPKENQNG